MILCAKASSGKVTTQWGLVGSLVIVLLQIFSWLWEWYNFEDKLIFGKVKAYKNCANFWATLYVSMQHYRWWYLASWLELASSGVQSRPAWCVDCFVRSKQKGERNGRVEAANDDQGTGKQDPETVHGTELYVPQSLFGGPVVVRVTDRAHSCHANVRARKLRHGKQQRCDPDSHGNVDRSTHRSRPVQRRQQCVRSKVRSFVRSLWAEGPAYSGPQRWDLFESVQCASPGRGGKLILCVCGVRAM